MLAFTVLSLATAVLSGTISVTVGDGGPVYKPNNFKAAKGDVVVFQFVAGIHTVSQSGGVDVPCVQLEGGFDSAFVPTAATIQGWNLTIEDDTRPIWFYCKQANHCQKGMAGVINAPDDDLINTYITNAKQFTAVQEPPQLSLQGVRASSNKAPGPLLGPGDATNPTAISTIITLSSVGTVSASGSPPTSVPGSASSSRVKTPVIIAIVAPAAALALAASALIVFLRRRRRRLHRDGMAPYPISARATQAPIASKLDPVPHTVAESEAGPTIASLTRPSGPEFCCLYIVWLAQASALEGLVDFV